MTNAGINTGFLSRLVFLGRNRDGASVSAFQNFFHASQKTTRNFQQIILNFLQISFILNFSFFLAKFSSLSFAVNMANISALLDILS